MRNFIVACDSFKGTLNAEEVCNIISDVIMQYIPYADVETIPMTDGGEGMADAYINKLGGIKKGVIVTGPMGRKVKGEYAVLDDNTVVTEAATCVGLPLVKETLNPMEATTYGVGEMLKIINEVHSGPVLFGVGGSATNDMGIGMAAALGYRFLDEEYNEVPPTLKSFNLIKHIVRPEKELKMDIVVACDVNNPLCGPTGATYTFGKQKGVPEEKMEELDRSMHKFAKVVEKEFGVSICNRPGAGAAGGLGAALYAFLGARLESGVDIFLDRIGFDEMLKSADMVFTGEGRIDWQTMSGKVPVGIARRAVEQGVPCIALCGSIGEKAELTYSMGISAIFSSIKTLDNTETRKEDYVENIRFLTDSVMKVLMLNEGGAGSGHGTVRSKKSQKVV